MAARYIPPHLRNQAPDPKAADDDGSNDHSIETSRRRLADLQMTPGEIDNFTLEEINAHFGDLTHHSTLHDSAAYPDKLSYLVLYRNANPRWESDRIIFVHTNIHILPGYVAFRRAMGEIGKSTQVTDPSEAATTRSGGKSGHDADVSIPAVITGKDASETVQPKEATRSSTRKPATGELAAAPSSEHSLYDDKIPIPAITRGENSREVAQTTKQEADIEHSSEKGKDWAIGVDPKEAYQTEFNVPIFSERPGPKSDRRFIFSGYFRILNIDFLKPQSPELIRMLEQKWVSTNRNSSLGSTRQRNAESWAKSLSQEWAVIKLEKVDKRGVEAPKIVRFDSEQG